MKPNMSANFSGNIKMSIVNAHGQTILSASISDIGGTFVKNIDLSNHAKGIYFVMIKTEESTEVKKIVIK